VLAVTGPHATEEVMAHVHRALPRPHDPFTDLVPEAGIKLTPRHYAYLKISEGCNHRCSFCIIPSMRGDLDSRPIGDVVREGGRRDPLLVLIRGVEGEAALVRTIAGADPARSAVAIADVLPLGAEVAFGVRDAAAARGDLAARLAAVARASGGATPAAALMFTCAGRGKGLFGVGDVDAKALRSKFAAPAAGMQSAFELAPWGGVTRAHLYKAVSSIFHRPSLRSRSARFVAGTSRSACGAAKHPPPTCGRPSRPTPSPWSRRLPPRSPGTSVTPRAASAR
jgi:hypothetical protein